MNRQHFTIDSGRYTVSLATKPTHVEEAQRLRHRVFSEAMPLQGNDSDTQLDKDPFDSFCHHLLVREKSSSQVVGTYRLLPDNTARSECGFFCETEVEASALYCLPGKILELGRAAVHPAHRGSGVIGLLWHGLCVYALKGDYDYFVGLCSVRKGQVTPSPASIYRYLRENHLSPNGPLVTPHASFSFISNSDPGPTTREALPALLKGYLRLGSELIGAPTDDGYTVSFPVLLDIKKIPSAYLRRFARYLTPAPLPMGPTFSSAA